MGVERELRFDIKKKRGVKGTSAETPPLPEIDDWTMLNPSGDFSSLHNFIIYALSLIDTFPSFKSMKVLIVKG